MSENTKNPKTAHLVQLMQQYGNGNDQAGEELCDILMPGLRRTIIGFLGHDDANIDDLMQDSFIALLHYLRIGGNVPDDPVPFVSTIIRNRCRNLCRWRKVRPHLNLDDIQQWYAAPDHSPLDLLVEGELLSILQEGLNSLGPSCSRLLNDIYLKKRSMNQLRQELGLSTVQAVYYRRNQCLDRLKKFFKITELSCPDHGKTKSRRKSGIKGAKNAK